MLNKQKSHAFGKDVYLLGTIDGKMQWLEAPSWDCNWYWGFGYVEEYTSHQYPSKSRDIVSHTHIDSLIKNKKVPMHDFEKCFEETTFNEKEKWELAELFKQFYLLKEMAEFTHRENPKSNIANTEVKHKPMPELHKEINEVMIPAITKRIIEILTPNGEF